jgi:hypothetical protein
MKLYSHSSTIHTQFDTCAMLSFVTLMIATFSAVVGYGLCTCLLNHVLSTTTSGRWKPLQSYTEKNDE